MATRNGQFHRAEVMVHNALGEAAEFRIQYLVSGCGWSLQYHIHTKRIGGLCNPKESIDRAVYREDWNDIQLILSRRPPDEMRWGRRSHRFACRLRMAIGEAKRMESIIRMSLLLNREIRAKREG